MCEWFDLYGICSMVSGRWFFGWIQLTNRDHHSISNVIRKMSTVDYWLTGLNRVMRRPKPTHASPNRLLRRSTDEHCIVFHSQCVSQSPLCRSVARIEYLLRLSFSLPVCFLKHSKTLRQLRSVHTFYITLLLGLFVRVSDFCFLIFLFLLILKKIYGIKFSHIMQLIQASRRRTILAPLKMKKKMSFATFTVFLFFRNDCE